MTKINRMVMQGFKSFANRTELSFGSDFNCVLGPNGAGKSNVMDALCFVLGKAGAKGLRAEKSANLIYNGGKLKKSAKQGEVSIYFDNSNNTFPTEDKEIKITRIITSNGTSKYKINDKPRTRSQILELLSIAKIDPNGYNIILQGDIVRFTDMPSNDRRVLIEDISGISIYEEKKHKALLELEKVETRLKDADIILSERGSYIKELRKDRDSALKYKEMNDKIRQNKASYLNIQIDKLQTHKSSFDKNITLQKEKITKINQIISKLKEQNNEKLEKLNQLNKTIENNNQNGQSNLTKDVEDLKVELAKNNTQIDTFKDEINRIKKQKQDLDSELKTITQKSKDEQIKKNEFINEKDNNLKSRDEIVAKITKFKKDNKLDEASDIENEVVEIDDKLETLQKNVHDYREKQQEIIRKKDNISYQINTVQDRIKKVKEIENENKEQIKELKKQKQEFTTTTAKLNDLLNNDSELAKSFSQKKQLLFNLEQELSKLNAKNVGIQENLLGDLAIKKILSLKTKKRGIYGLIADLGNVNSKYSQALEVAAGPRIKSIVVEDDKTAAECISHLKQNKYGTASFLPLNKINVPNQNNAIENLKNKNGCHGFAIDLVKFDLKYKKAFEYVFSNTLVVDNIETARNIGIGKSKMVTLDGDVTERSGVMKGGFRHKKKGLGFKEKDLLQDIEKCNADVSNLNANIQEIEQKRVKNEEEIEDLRQKKANLEGEIIVKEKSLHLEDTDMQISAKQMDTLNKELEFCDKNLTEIIAKISEINKELANKKIRKESLRSEIKQLKNPLLLAELNTFEEMKIKVNEEIIRLDTEIKAIDEQISTHHNGQHNKAKQLIEQSKNQAVEFEEKIKLLKENNSKLNIELKEKEKKANEFYSKFKNMFDKKKKLDDEIRDNENVIDKKKDENRDIEIKSNEYSIKLQEVNERLSELNKEFEEYHGVDILTNVNEEDLKKEISKFERAKDSIGSVNMRALDIYDDVEKEYNTLLEKKKKLIEEKEDVVIMMNEIDSKKKGLFMQTYNIIKEKFKKNFSQLTKAGEVDLELEDEETIFNGGVNIRVRITGNKFLDIRSLSGGEKTMTALSFIFAIQEHEPAYFYILDEVDAALDKHNSERLSLLIKEHSSKAQYILISHNDSIISNASKLYGVSMDQHNVSKVVSLDI
jgi:chromosome segregation protein